MKRLILALAAVATVAGPMAAATSASAQPRNNNWDRNDRDNRDNRDNRGGYDNRSGYDNRGYDNRRGDRDNRGDYRRTDRRDNQWDSRYHNGYYYGGRWNYGAPPQSYYGRSGFRPGYQAWQRGSYLPREYRGYAVYDYGRYRLRPPPRGYQWVRVNDDFILEALATGLIADVLLGAGRY